MHNAALPAMSGLPCIGRLMARGFASSASASSAASHGSADASTLIRNVWCLGRSYAEHIRELDNAGPGGTIPQGPPMIFLKAGSSCLPSGQPLLLPKWSSDVHHEVELALQLGPDLRPVRGAVALDLTLRDVQSKLKKAQHPWTLAKSFKGSTPLGPWFSLAPSGSQPGSLDLHNLNLLLRVNGQTRQADSTAKMLFKVDDVIAYLVERFPVVPGDVVLTGTPHGVSALRHGDQVVAQVLSSSGEVLSHGQWTAVSEAAQA